MVGKSGIREIKNEPWDFPWLILWIAQFRNVWLLFF
jgi:hypothetical protein